MLETQVRTPVHETGASPALGGHERRDPVSVQRRISPSDGVDRVLGQYGRRDSVVWSGAARSTPINDKTDRKKPAAWRKGNRKTRRRVHAVSIAQSENVFGAPGRPDGAGRHAAVASAESHSVTSPRWTKACSYADQCPTRYFVLYFGWTFDLMSRSCTRSGHRGQRAYSCLVAAEGLCTNARSPSGTW